MLPNDNRWYVYLRIPYKPSTGRKSKEHKQRWHVALYALSCTHKRTHTIIIITSTLTTISQCTIRSSSHCTLRWLLAATVGLSFTIAFDSFMLVCTRLFMFRMQHADQNILCVLCVRVQVPLTYMLEHILNISVLAAMGITAAVLLGVSGCVRVFTHTFACVFVFVMAFSVCMSYSSILFCTSAVFLVAHLPSPLLADTLGKYTHQLIRTRACAHTHLQLLIYQV